MIDDTETLHESQLAPKVVEVLVNNHSQFLSFLQARVGDRAVAEEILQTALVKGLEKADTIRSEQRVTAWFFRLLRNSLIDYYRRRAKQGRTLEPECVELESLPDEELQDTVCKCVNSLVPTLKSEYAAILEAVEIRENSLEQFARDHGITLNNATVRMHRAR